MNHSAPAIVRYALALRNLPAGPAIRYSWSIYQDMKKAAKDLTWDDLPGFVVAIAMRKAMDNA